MDNSKTGSFIKELRKEKGMTQKELAERLHITDRAVSKWERGLCAPDIALLESLANALDTSIAELIDGEKSMQAKSSGETEAHTKNLIDYSKRELACKVGILRKRYLGSIAVCLAIVLGICGFLLWRGGHLFVMDKRLSPDKSSSITVYSKALSSAGFSMEDATSLIVKQQGTGELRITYRNCTYQGIWWAPDSRKYVLSLKDGENTQLILTWLDRSSASNLNAYLSMGVEMTELSKYGCVSENGWPKIEYQFLQWGLDSKSMLLYYAFEAQNGSLHEGYFWYDCENGTISSVLELGP